MRNCKLLSYGVVIRKEINMDSGCLNIKCDND